MSGGPVYVDPNTLNDRERRLLDLLETNLVGMNAGDAINCLIQALRCAAYVAGVSEANLTHLMQAAPASNGDWYRRRRLLLTETEGEA